MFTKGQQVWCVIFGEGVVSRLVDGPFPVEVKFLNGEEEPYTSTGHFFRREGNQSLFPYPVKVSRDESVATKPSIDWSQVKEEYQWLAADANEYAYAFKGEPEPELDDSGYWRSGGRAYFSVNGLVSYSRGICNWKDSLVKRPEGETP